MFLEIIEWILVTWLTLAFIKIVMIYGQLLKVAKCYAKVFKREYSSSLVLDVFLSAPFIVTLTAPLIFMTELWKFFFLYTEEELIDIFQDIKEEMSKKS